MRSTGLHRPKSDSFICPSTPSSKLSGLMSLQQMQNSCAFCHVHISRCLVWRGNLYGCSRLCTLNSPVDVIMAMYGFQGQDGLSNVELRLFHRKNVFSHQECLQRHDCSCSLFAKALEARAQQMLDTYDHVHSKGAVPRQMSHVAAC